MFQLLDTKCAILKQHQLSLAPRLCRRLQGSVKAKATGKPRNGTAERAARIIKSETLRVWRPPRDTRSVYVDIRVAKTLLRLRRSLSDPETLHALMCRGETESARSRSRRSLFYEMTDCPGETS